MNFFISDALANTAPAQGQAPGGSPYFTLVLMGVMFVAFYFLLIRPQSKRAKEHKAMVAALGKGDEVVTAGGMMGRITRVQDNSLTIEVASGIEIQFQRQAVQTILPKGTVKFG
ncbi:MAG: preprotein translocase subunit YajC [Pseudomonadota bacterium]